MSTCHTSENNLSLGLCYSRILEEFHLIQLAPAIRRTSSSDPWRQSSPWVRGHPCTTWESPPQRAPQSCRTTGWSCWSTSGSSDCRNRTLESAKRETFGTDDLSSYEIFTLLQRTSSLRALVVKILKSEMYSLRCFRAWNLCMNTCWQNRF